MDGDRNATGVIDMNTDEFKKRTQEFAVDVIKLVEALPKSPTVQASGRQLLRSGTSVGANYRSACRAGSHADFVAKMGIVEEECDETLYWMELLIKADQTERTLVDQLMREAHGILSMVVASIKTARSRR